MTLSVPITTIITINTPPKMIPLASLGSFVSRSGVGEGVIVSCEDVAWLVSAADCVAAGSVDWPCAGPFTKTMAVSSMIRAMIIVICDTCLRKESDKNRIGNLILMVMVSEIMLQRLSELLLQVIVAA